MFVSVRANVFVLQVIGGALDFLMRKRSLTSSHPGVSPVRQQSLEWRVCISAPKQSEFQMLPNIISQVKPHKHELI